jgi:hypothetical protein
MKEVYGHRDKTGRLNLSENMRFEDEQGYYLLTPAELEAVRREAWEAARELENLQAVPPEDDELVQAYETFEEWMAAQQKKETMP